jgi:hypothetical protein
MASTFSLKNMVDRQVGKVLERGSRFSRFDQIRNRHFWSTYLFAPGAGNAIAANGYSIFNVPVGSSGQGYPTNVPLTLRETNWRNTQRIPDNQNFAVTEIGVSIHRIPACDFAGSNGAPAHAPTDGIYANLPAAIQALVNVAAPIHPLDAASLLYGIVLEMSYLTNNIPIGWCSDFSQSGGVHSFEEAVTDLTVGGPVMGDPTNGVPAAAFRRKLDIPILLQHGETASMTLRVPRAIPTLTLDEGGTGAFEVKVDWWAVESFVEKS